MEMKLELVPVPVSDVDRAKTFYVEKCGFKLEVDVQPTDAMRVVQLTPPGSACSILSDQAFIWNEIAVDSRSNVYINGGGFDAPGIIVLVTPDGSVRQVADDIAFPMVWP